jgi:hypothetical protein
MANPMLFLKHQNVTKRTAFLVRNVRFGNLREVRRNINLFTELAHRN